MRNLRNLFPSVSIPSSPQIPQPQPQPQTTVDASAILAVEKIFAMRQKIIKTIIDRNRF